MKQWEQLLEEKKVLLNDLSVLLRKKIVKSGKISTDITGLNEGIQTLQEKLKKYAEGTSRHKAILKNIAEYEEARKNAEEMLSEIDGIILKQIQSFVNDPQKAKQRKEAFLKRISKESVNNNKAEEKQTQTQTTPPDFLLTEEDKNKLFEFGYSQQDINEMKVQDAKSIIEGGIIKPVEPANENNQSGHGENHTNQSAQTTTKSTSQTITKTVLPKKEGAKKGSSAGAILGTAAAFVVGVFLGVSIKGIRINKN